MEAERAIFDHTDAAAEAAADARADADHAAGRSVDHAEVAAWLSKWGTADETPMPPEWLA
jgi:predicted transcriptional regulator